MLDAFEQENAALEKSKKRRRDLISILMLLSQISGISSESGRFRSRCLVCVSKAELLQGR